ncbi:MAG: DUF3782 domain-containing protein [Verrucomicrobiae bacterium]|nr:DUF3782 domain-containing protein [Verrucomicrobiae bacterium]
MTTQELDQRLATLAEQIAATDRQIAATDRRIAESSAETDRQIQETNRQIGGLSNKFGSFTEGLAYRSCKRILREQFGMEQTAHEVEVERADGQNQEYDMLGVVNGERNEVMMVEIKSHLRDRDLQQTLVKLQRLPEFLPHYKGMRIHGLIAAVYLPKGMEAKVAEAGLYLATGADENFELMPPPPGFRPRDF